MKTKSIKDERVTQLNNKVQSEAYLVITALLLVSVFIKAYVLNTSVSAYTTELLVMISSGLYVAIRGSLIGSSSNLDPKFRKKLLGIVIVIVSLILAIISGIHNYLSYGNKYTGPLDGHFLIAVGITFVSLVIFTSLVMAALYYIEEWGQKRLEKNLEDDQE